MTAIELTIDIALRVLQFIAAVSLTVALGIIALNIRDALRLRRAEREYARNRHPSRYVADRKSAELLEEHHSALDVMLWEREISGADQ